MNHKNITPGTLVESSVSSTDISSDEINQLKAQIQANEKWLTDITEFAIPSGKVYLSPIVDCFDGLLVNWNISTSPDALLVNSMLDNAAKLLSVGEKPIIHSDRGVHYRWPGWIDRMEKNGFIRSMSKKGCSPDNSACEGEEREVIEKFSDDDKIIKESRDLYNNNCDLTFIKMSSDNINLDEVITN